MLTKVVKYANFVHAHPQRLFNDLQKSKPLQVALGAIALFTLYQAVQRRSLFLALGAATGSALCFKDQIYRTYLKKVYSLDLDSHELNKVFSDACYCNNLILVEDFLDRKLVQMSDFNQEDTPPHIHAALLGYKPMMQRLLKEKDLNPNDPTRIFERTILELAIDRGHIETAKEIISSAKCTTETLGKSLRSLSKKGEIPLLKEIVERPDIQEEHLLAPFLCSVFFKEHATVQFLYQCQKISQLIKFQALGLAACEGDLQTIRIAAPYTSDIEKTSSLIQAAKKGHLEAVALLHSLGNIDYHFAPEEGEDALQQASACGQLGVVRYLIGIHTHTRSQLERAFSASVDASKELVAIELFQHVKLSTESLANLIEQIGKKGLGHLLEIVLKSEENLTVPPLNQALGKALCYASQRGYLTTLKTLLNHSADCNYKFNGNQSPLKLAITHYHHDAVKMLLEHKELAQEEKWLGFCEAINGGHNELVSLFIENYGSAIHDLKFGSIPLPVALFRKNLISARELKEEHCALIDVKALLNEFPNDQRLCDEVIYRKAFHLETKNVQAYPRPYQRSIREVIWIKQKLREHRCSTYHTLIKEAVQKEKVFALRYLFTNEPLAQLEYIMKYQGDLSFLQNGIMTLDELEAPDDTDTMPKPHIPFELDRLISIKAKLEESPDTYPGISQMVENIKNKAPLAGLPSVQFDREQFIAVYNRIESNLKVIGIALDELYTKYEESKDLDLKEKLVGLCHRISDIGTYCGTRYVQDLPLLYHNELSQFDLKCLKLWKSQKVALPPKMNPKDAVIAHLKSSLYHLKMSLLIKIYDQTKQTSDAHELSSFWKSLKTPFLLGEGVDVDPLAKAYHYPIQEIRRLFWKELKPEMLIEATLPQITINGWDNPYYQLITDQCNKYGLDNVLVLSKIFQVDTLTGESKGVSKEGVAFILRLLGLIR